MTQIDIDPSPSSQLLSLDDLPRWCDNHLFHDQDRGPITSGMPDNSRCQPLTNSHDHSSINGPIHHFHGIWSVQLPLDLSLHIYMYDWTRLFDLSRDFSQYTTKYDCYIYIYIRYWGVLLNFKARNLHHVLRFLLLSYTMAPSSPPHDWLALLSLKTSVVMLLPLLIQRPTSQ